MVTTAPADETPSLTDELPRWDLDSLYPGVGSAELQAAIDRFTADVAALAGDLSTLETRPGAEPVGSAFDRLVERLNGVLTTYSPVQAYLYGKVTADTTDDAAQGLSSVVEERAIAFNQVMPRLSAWLAAQPDEALADGSTTLSDYRDLVVMARRRARHLLPPAEENLLAELNPTAGLAWARLRQDIASQIMVQLGGDDEHAARPIPITAARNLAYDADRDVRRRAYEAELGGWREAAVPIAAAMNGIKGQVNALSRRRTYASALDEGLESNRLDRATLDALVSTTEEAFPLFRRFLDAKARLLGIERLAWYDLFAPVGADATDGKERWSWERSCAFVERHFRGFDPALGDLARRAFAERWVDAGPRPGKVGGAYCMSFIGEQSRILSNFTPSYSGMGTLAHELGHAWHNYVQRDEPPARRGSPMVVAETASTFCETIIRRAALDEAPRDEQIVILESFLSDTTQITLDILSRFRFEQAVFAERRERQLSVDELCGLMTDAQRGTYGDALDPDLLHPFAWASKPHYYDGESFYNYPYLFGQLFGVGLYSSYSSDPAAFHARYADLLRRTGQADPADLAADFGVDIRDVAFWQSSLDVIATDIDTFVGLVDAATA